MKDKRPALRLTKEMCFPESRGSSAFGDHGDFRAEASVTYLINMFIAFKYREDDHNTE